MNDEVFSATRYDKGSVGLMDIFSKMIRKTKYSMAFMAVGLYFLIFRIVYSNDDPVVYADVLKTNLLCLGAVLLLCAALIETEIYFFRKGIKKLSDLSDKEKKE